MGAFLRITILIALIFNINNFAESGLEVWKFKTRGIIYSTPLIHNNVLYVGCLDSTLYAIDAKTGIEKWHYKTTNKIFSSPAIYNNIICIESGNKLYALSLSGNLLWLAVMCPGSVTNQIDTWDYFHSSPNIVDGTVYIGTEKGLVYGFNIETGDTVFHCNTGRQQTAIRTKPAIYNNKIYFGDFNGYMYSYDLTTQQKVWEFDTNPEKLWTGTPAIGTNPIINNGSIYFSGKCSIVYSLNAETGEKNWRYLSPTKQWLVGGPTINDTILFIGSSDQHLFHAINVNSGLLLWKNLLEGRIFSTPFVDGDYVYFGTGVEVTDKIGSLYAINKLTGEYKSRFTTGRQIHSSPVIVDGIIYFGSADGYLHAVDKQKLLSVSYSKTYFKEKGALNVGDIQNDTTVTVWFENKGDGPDSATVTLEISTSLKDAVTSNLQYFIIAPGDSQKVEIIINASVLPPKSNYLITLKVKSTNNLEFNSLNFNKAILFNKISPTEVGFNKLTLPDNYLLYQNYPNPFNPKTQIRFGLPVESHVIIRLFDPLGRIVNELINSIKTAGYHEIHLDGSHLSSGIYFCSINADATDGSRNFRGCKKIMLLK